MSKDVRAGGAYVELGLRSQIDKGLQAAGEKLRGFGKTAALAGGAVFGAAAAMVSPLLSAASNAQETASKFDVVFGANADSVRAWGNATAQEFGRSRQQVEEFMASSQDLFIPLGFDTEGATDASQTLTKLAMDLASFNNKTDAEAMADLQAAVTGSGEVMKKYGVVLNEAGIKQEMVNKGWDPKNATNAQKAQAALNIILKGTTNAQGDAVRTADSYANQLKRLWGNVNDLAVALGTHLIPPATAVLKFFNAGANAVLEFAQKNEKLVRNLVYMVGIVGAVGGVLLGLGTAALGLGVIIPPIVAAFGVFTSIVSTIAAPLAIAAAAITAVGVVAWANRDFIIQWAMLFWDALKPIRNALTQILDIVKSTFAGIFEAIYIGDYKAAVSILWTGIQAAFFKGASLAMEAFVWLVDKGRAVLGQLVGFVGGWASSLFAPIMPALSAVAGLVGGWASSLFAPIMPAISDAGSNIGSAFQAGFGIITDGLASLFTHVKEVFGGIGAALVDGNFGLAADIVWATIKHAFAAGIEFVGDLWAGFILMLSDGWTGLTTTIITFFGGALSTIAGLVPGVGLIGEVIQSVFGDAFSFVMDGLSSFFGGVMETFDGLGNALAAGNFALAFDILWATIQLAFVAGIGTIKKLWSGFTIGLDEVWATLTHNIVSVFQSAMMIISRVMQAAVSKVAEILRSVAEYDPTGAAGKIANALDTVANLYGAAETEFGNQQQAAAAARLKDQIANGQASLDAEKRINADIKASRDKRDALLSQAKQGNQRGATAAAKEDLDKLTAQARKGIGNLGITGLADERLKSLIGQVDKTTKAADEQRVVDTQKQQTEGIKAAESVKQNSGTFSAAGAALLGLGGGGSVNEKIAKNTEANVKATERVAGAVDAVAANIKNIATPRFG